MDFERGTVVRSRAGRDKDTFLAVLAREGSTVLVADGKERPVERPKKKNIRHLSATSVVLEEENLKYNSRLHRALTERFSPDSESVGGNEHGKR